MVAGPVIRQAMPGERSGVMRTVVAAFVEDPGWAFILGGEYGRLAAQFVGALFDLRVSVQNVWVTDDLAAVAMWDPPGESDAAAGFAESVWSGYRTMAGEDAFERLTRYREAVAVAFPSEPYWYLGVLATDPERQREGLASAVLDPVLENADWLGIACCLETSTADNRAFYERRGFTHTTDVVAPRVQLPNDMPTLLHIASG